MRFWLYDTKDNQKESFEEKPKLFTWVRILRFFGLK
jgi:hypothetical protein